MGSFVGGSTSIIGSSRCPLPEKPTARAPLVLLPRVVGMLAVGCLVCCVVMCGSASCGVCDLCCVQQGKIYRPVLLTTQWSKATFRTETPPIYTSVRIYSNFAVVCVDVVYVRVCFIICSS